LCLRTNAGIPIDLPVSTINSMRASGFNLPPINNKAIQSPISSKPTSKGVPQMPPPMPLGMPPLPPGMAPPMHNQHAKKLLDEYEREMARIKEENAQLRYAKEISERDYQNVMTENNGLMSKLENLENIFVGAPIQKPATGGGASIGTEKYAISKVFFYVMIIGKFRWK